MISVIYLICLIISVGNLVYLSQKKYKSTDKYLWTLLVLFPIVILGYWIKTTVHTGDAATVAFCFIYLDSTVMPVILLFSMLKNMNKEVSSWVKLTAYILTAIHLFTIWISRDTNLYYNSVVLDETWLGTATRMSSGPLKITHYLFLTLLLLAFSVILIIGFIKRGKWSRKSLVIYSAFGVLVLVVYSVEAFIHVPYTSLPIFYTFGSFIITINYEHIQSHDIFNLIGEKQAQTGLRGFCAFDKKRCLLGYNNQFAQMLPDIVNVVVDEKIPEKFGDLSHYINSAIDSFELNKAYSEKVVIGEKSFLIIVSDFSVNYENKSNGYLVEMSDITDDQKKIDTIEKYNERLSEEVNSKTEHILEIQNSVVLGLANMVENRDDNTGGHVKRTSDVIKLLVEEIRKHRYYSIDEQKAKDIIRSAPMHDLGKISIDNSILCKKGRLTDEEYTIMKTHATKSGEIVKIILEGVEEQHFVDVAFNVARHHHERWDGKGYPDGLMGESIPEEARIMAVADVYDALVSKRCYKEPMNFEDAFRIMTENMGSQFDPAMRPVFVACRSKLEEYYSQHK